MSNIPEKKYFDTNFTTSNLYNNNFNKAFDTRDHEYYLKNDFYTIRGVSGDSLKSPFSNSSQFVSLDTTVSNKECSTYSLSCSVLGPILFNLYINDLIDVSIKFKYVLFADNTSNLYSNNKFKNFQSTINR